MERDVRLKQDSDQLVKMLPRYVRERASLAVLSGDYGEFFTMFTGNPVIVGKLLGSEIGAMFDDDPVTAVYFLCSILETALQSMLPEKV